jgi:Tfp pilus assembly protein PilX
MKRKFRHNGSVLLIAIFVTALLSAVVIGILQLNTEEVQLMLNQIYAAEALATAEAGLNDAFAELRADSSWAAGFTDKAFAGGSYSVTVAGTLPDLVISSTGTSSHGFVAKVETKVTVGSSAPYVIRIDEMRTN